MDKKKLMRKINSELELIFHERSLTPEDRGHLGETVIGRMADYWTSNYKGSFVKKSFIYPQGPVMPSRSSSEPNPVTEIDCLIITPHRILVVEIKTIYGRIKFYENHQMEIATVGDFKGTYDSKNYLRQNEMHARHLYYHLHTILPKGLPKYIQPVIVMVGNSTIVDERTPLDKQSQIIVTANEFIPLLEKLYKPLENSIDVSKIKSKLNSIEVKGQEGFDRLLRSQDFYREGQPV